MSEAKLWPRSWNDFESFLVVAVSFNVITFYFLVSSASEPGMIVFGLRKVNSYKVLFYVDFKVRQHSTLALLFKIHKKNVIKEARGEGEMKI